jgi:hypothetical protein
MYTTGLCVTWFNAPLFDASFYGPVFGNEMASAFKHVRGLVLGGVPPSKILHGVPFYGREYAGNVGTSTSGPLFPRQSYPNAGVPSMTESYTGYNAIPALYVAAEEHWDVISQTPFLSIANADPTLNAYLTYDDPSSITSKLCWGIGRNIGGMSIWELSLDYFSGRTIKSPLLDAIKCVYPHPAVANGAAPAAPASLTFQTLSAAHVTLNWSAVAAATSYNVKRSLTSGSGYATIASVSGPSYTDASLASGTTYYYVITAVNLQTEGAVSPQATVLASASSPPAAPTALAASSVTPTAAINLLQVTLTWTGTAARYLIKRSTQISGGPYVVLASLTAATYTDVLLAPGLTYYYTVSAVATGLESANATELSVASGAYVPANLLGSPNDISASPWIVGGTGVSVVDATHLQTATAGISSLLQTAVPVSPNTDYIGSISLASPTVAGFVTLSVYAPGWTPIPASTGQWVQAGVAASFTLPFNTLGNSTVIFELDLDVNLINATVAVTLARIGVKLPGSTNLLPNAAAINLSPWNVGGTAAAATGPSTLQCASSGVTSLAQQSVPVTPNTNYTATMTLASTVATGFAVLNLYSSGYAAILAHAGMTLLATNATLTVNFNSGSQTALVFELDLDSGTAGHVLTVTAVSLVVTPDAVQQW